MDAYTPRHMHGSADLQCGGDSVSVAVCIQPRSTWTPIPRVTCMEVLISSVVEILSQWLSASSHELQGRLYPASHALMMLMISKAMEMLSEGLNPAKNCKDASPLRHI